MRPFRSGGTSNIDAIKELIQSAKRNGIKRLCVSSLGDEGYTNYPKPEEFISANAYVLEMMRIFPEILGFCSVNPQHTEESLAELDRYIPDGGMVGVKFWIACKASDRQVDPVVRRVIELNVPILQHAWYKTTGNYEHESTPADVADLAERFPDVTLIMAHLHGAGYRGILDIAPYPNVLVDVSGGEPETTVVEFGVQELGAERIVFGSDAPGRSFGVQLGKVLGANISDEAKELILHGNAERILRL